MAFLNFFQFRRIYLVLEEYSRNRFVKGKKKSRVPR